MTDDKRNEVAERLRELRSGWSSGECYYTIIHALGLPDTSREDGGAALYELLADLIKRDDPPYNLYTLYEAVFHCSPRCWECIEDDEVDELVDALLDICNAPGHEHIQRPQPSYNRDALLALADRMEEMAGKGACLTPDGLEAAASSIREALGVGK